MSEIKYFKILSESGGLFLCKIHEAQYMEKTKVNPGILLLDYFPGGSTDTAEPCDYCPLKNIDCPLDPTHVLSPNSTSRRIKRYVCHQCGTVKDITII